MTRVHLAERDATVLWQGDVVVLGAGLAGLTAGLTAADKGKRVCVIEPGPTLGVEVSQMWQPAPHKGPLALRLNELCTRQGGRCEDRTDTFVATLAFDQIVREAGIEAIVRVLPVRPVADVAGRLAGVEVVGKSGRQLVAAPLAIDATQDRCFSRRFLGLSLATPRTVQRRLYFHGVKLPAEGRVIAVARELRILDDQVHAVPAAWQNEAILTFGMPAPVGISAKVDGVAGTLEIAVRLTAHLRLAVPEFAEATLVDVAPEPDMERVTSHAEFAPLADTGLCVLPCADDLSAEMVQAEEATATALTLDRERDELPRGAAGFDPSQVLRTYELNAAPEQDLAAMELPVVDAHMHPYRDVVVAGYGTGGAFAALSAAAEGVSVTVLDPAPFPGGIGTAGKIHSYYHGVVSGLQQRIDELVKGRDAGLGTGVFGFHPIGKAQVLLDALRQETVELFAGHMVFGVIKEGDRVQGIVSANEDGYHVFPCQVLIDCTGDGDVAAAAGASFGLGREGDGFPQPYSYTPSYIRDGKLAHRNFDAGWVDPTDTLAYSTAHFEGRVQLWRQGPFTAQRHYCSLAPLLGIREGRFMRGRRTLTFDDFMEGRTYPDTVCEAYAHHDNHAMDYAEESEWARRHVVMFGLWRYLCRGHVPYDTLVPANIEGVLVACRALSVDHDMHQLLRMQRDVQQLGEICGLAAAMAVHAGQNPGGIDVEELRRRLDARGILPKHSPDPVLPLPSRELFAKLDADVSGLAMWRLSKSVGPDLPDWKAFFDTEADENARFAAAVAAALAGALVDGARQVLVRACDERWDEPRLGVKSPPRYIVAALALAEARDADAANRLGEILLDSAELDPPTQLLLLRALGHTRDGRSIAIIREFLRRTEQNEFAVPLWGAAPDWPTSFRFAIDLRAVRSLIELGCLDECARITPYLQHPNLLVRRHARKVAQEAESARV